MGRNKRSTVVGYSPSLGLNLPYFTLSNPINKTHGGGVGLDVKTVTVQREQEDGCQSSRDLSRKGYRCHKHSRSLQQEENREVREPEGDNDHGPMKR